MSKRKELFKSWIDWIKMIFRNIMGDFQTKDSDKEDIDWDTERSKAMKTLKIDRHDLNWVKTVKGKNKEQIVAQLLSISPKDAKVVVNFSTLTVAEKIQLLADTPEHFGKFFNFAHAHYLKKSKNNRNSWKKKPWEEHAGKCKGIIDRILDKKEYKLADLYELTVRLYYMAKLKFISSEKN